MVLSSLDIVPGVIVFSIVKIAICGAILFKSICGKNFGYSAKSDTEVESFFLGRGDSVMGTSEVRAGAEIAGPSVLKKNNRNCLFGAILKSHFKTR